MTLFLLAMKSLFKTEQRKLKANQKKMGDDDDVIEKTEKNE